MTLKDFLNKNNLTSQAALARSLGVSPQSLKQYLERESPTFTLLMREHYPRWVCTFENNEWKFILGDGPGVGGSNIYTRSKKDLLQDNDSISQTPAVYCFIAALDCDPIDLALDYDRQCLYIGRPGSSEAFAWFPFDQVSELVAALEANEEF